jgi:hypothetical protein
VECIRRRPERHQLSSQSKRVPVDGPEFGSEGAVGDGPQRGLVVGGDGAELVALPVEVGGEEGVSVSPVVVGSTAAT